MPNIHPQAVVSGRAHVGQGVEIGPFCVVEDHVVLGDGCHLASHVVVKRGTRLGDHNRLDEGVVIGARPQHERFVSSDEGGGGVHIGSGNVFREQVTVHRSLEEGTATTIGDGNLLMVGAHVAHDCKLGNHIIMVNNVLLAGHVTLGDQACLGGASGVHQFCRVGRLAMIGACTKVTKDVPPFVLVDSNPATVVGLNTIGLRRARIPVEERTQLKAAFRLIYRSGLPWQEMLAHLKADFPDDPAGEFYDFLAGGTRGFTPARRQALEIEPNDEGQAQGRPARIAVAA